MNNRKISIFLLLLFILVLFGFFYLGLNWILVKSVVVEPQKISDKNIFTASLEINAKEFFSTQSDEKNDTNSINSSSAISTKIINNEIKILFEKNKDKKLPIASLTKLMTALIVLEKYDLSQKFVINKRAMAEIGEQGNLKEGETLSIKNLLYIMLIESSNRAAYALSEVMGNDRFVEEMNNKAKLIDLSNTYFIDSTGLDPNSYSTAKDLVILSRYLFEKYPIFREIMELKSFRLYINGEFHHKLINSNQLLGENRVIGGKTGFTDEARGCFITIQKDNENQNYFINVILGAEDRFLEMRKLINLVN